MRRQSWLKDLQWQLLLWAGVVTVALSLLAMHQLSVNHTAANPTPPVIAQLDLPGGEPAGDVSFFADPRSDDHAHSTGHVNHSHVGAAANGNGPSAPAGACPGCAEHQAMAADLPGRPDLAGHGVAAGQARALAGAFVDRPAAGARRQLANAVVNRAMNSKLRSAAEVIAFWSASLVSRLAAGVTTLAPRPVESAQPLIEYGGGVSLGVDGDEDNRDFLGE